MVRPTLGNDSKSGFDMLPSNCLFLRAVSSYPSYGYIRTSTALFAKYDDSKVIGASFFSLDIKVTKETEYMLITDWAGKCNADFILKIRQNWRLHSS